MTTNSVRGLTRPDLPVVVGGKTTAGTAARSVSVRSVLGSSPGRARRARRSARWWTATWCVAVAVCASSAFAIRDTMFPRLGRTEAPSAWEAPTRPPASIPYVEREGPVQVPTGTTVPAAGAAAGGTPLATGSVHDSTPPGPSTDTHEDPAPTAPSGPSGSPGASPSVPSWTSDPGLTDTSAPTTTDNAPPTSGTDDTLPDDGTGGGGGRGSGSGGSADDTVP